MSPATIAITRDQLQQKRNALLTKTGLAYEELRARAESYTLTQEQRQVWESIRTFDYLLADE